MHNPAPVLEKATHKLLWDFNIQTDHLISARRPDFIIINKKKKKKKRTCKIVYFTVPADHRIKLKECENKDKYLDLARELKKLWNMQVTIIPIVIGAFGTVTKGLLKRLEDLEVGGRVETIQTIALLRTARILRRVRETWGDLLSLRLQWKPSSNADVKSSNEWIIHDWVGKDILWAMCKILKFEQTNKWYIHKQESVSENETHNIFWDFWIQTHHLILAKRPNLVMVNKKIEPAE